MKMIIEENYKSIVNRGLITSKTTIQHFVMKLEEEVQEYIDARIHGQGNPNEELSDIILVCLNIAKHYNIDIETELINKININKSRCKK